MWTLWAVLGCGSDQKIGPVNVDDELALDVDPVDIDFGAVALGQSAEQALTLRNDGTSDVLLAELRTSSTDIALIGFASLKVSAGGEEELTIQWTPSDAIALDGSLDLRVGTTLSALTDIQVPVVGTVTGAKLVISEQSADLGIVSVGCTATLSIDARNTGTEDLVIQSLQLTNDAEFTLEDGRGGQVVLPIRIPPGDSAIIDLVYTPIAEHRVSTTLQIQSNDALAPTTNVSVEGEGLIEASNTMFWTVEGRQALTAIVQVNDFLLNYTHASFGERVLEFLPALFEGLRDAELSYRLAIVVHEAGEVAGDVPYIDDSFTVDEADAAADAMLDESSLYGDNDQGLETCLNAIEANEAWLFESDLWIHSRLNLLVINNDAEQSPGDFTHYVDVYGKYKDPEDFAVHGIAGEPPSGCTDGAGGYAAPSNNLKNAADATGGVFLSVCDPDWTKSVPTLIEGLAGGIEMFVLEKNPAPESIEVRVDGAQLSSGWWYEEKTRTIDFDDATYPARGSELRVDYLMAVSCE
jgi:hypothetical protein